MHSQIVLKAVILSAGVAIAQTPNGFDPGTDTNLGVAFNGKSVTPGLVLTREETSKVPTYSLPAGSLSSEGPYLIMVVDLDVPIRSGSTVTGRQELLHQLTLGYTLAPNGTLIAPPDAEDPNGEPTESSPAPFRGPMPPAENPPRPHRYVELLFAQPDAFEVPEDQDIVVEDRVGFNASTFVAAASLDPPLAANYFVVTNNTAAGQTGSGVLMPASTLTSELPLSTVSATGTGGASTTGNASVPTASATAPVPPESTGGAAKQVVGAITGLLAAGIAGLLL